MARLEPPWWACLCLPSGGLVDARIDTLELNLLVRREPAAIGKVKRIGVWIAYPLANSRSKIVILLSQISFFEGIGGLLLRQDHQLLGVILLRAGESVRLVFR